MTTPSKRSAPRKAQPKTEQQTGAGASAKEGTPTPAGNGNGTARKAANPARAQANGGARQTAKVAQIGVPASQQPSANPALSLKDQVSSWFRDDKDFENLAKKILKNTPEGDDRYRALRKLQEAHWATKHAQGK